MEILYSHGFHVLRRERASPLCYQPRQTVVLQEKLAHRRHGVPNHGCYRLHTMGAQGSDGRFVRRLSLLRIPQGKLRHPGIGPRDSGLCWTRSPPRQHGHGLSSTPLPRELGDRHRGHFVPGQVRRADAGATAHGLHHGIVRVGPVPAREPHRVPLRRPPRRRLRPPDHLLGVRAGGGEHHHPRGPGLPAGRAGAGGPAGGKLGADATPPLHDRLLPHHGGGGHGQRGGGHHLLRQPRHPAGLRAVVHRPPQRPRLPLAPQAARKVQLLHVHQQRALRVHRRRAGLLVHGR
mmetsp:Transcript_27995/g.58309  ORF Transcript_27995/g.58309 Transcript_27995/m.58309 type:complete len:291 (-) Transcript_27995:239-1111(-)